MKHNKKEEDKKTKLSESEERASEQFLTHPSPHVSVSCHAKGTRAVIVFRNPCLSNEEHYLGRLKNNR